MNSHIDKELFIGLVLPPSQSKYIWNISWLSLISSVYGYYKNKHLRLYLIPLSVFITSIMYWWKPDYSWRRYLDICVVVSGLSYQLYFAINTTNCLEYYCVSLLACVSYALSSYYYDKHTGVSTFWHCMLHLFGNIGNIILYVGI
jgi:hypothetical protein